MTTPDFLGQRTDEEVQGQLAIEQTLLNAEPVGQQADRGSVPPEIAQDVYALLGTLEPQQRADLYGTYTMIAMEDPEALSDVEIMVLSSAHNDWRASEAVKEEQTWDPLWYDQNVDYGGDTGKAQEQLFMMFGTEAPQDTNFLGIPGIPVNADYDASRTEGVRGSIYSGLKKNLDDYQGFEPPKNWLIDTVATGLDWMSVGAMFATGAYALKYGLTPRVPGTGIGTSPIGAPASRSVVALQNAGNAIGNANTALGLRPFQWAAMRTGTTVPGMLNTAANWSPRAAQVANWVGGTNPRRAVSSLAFVSGKKGFDLMLQSTTPEASAWQNEVLAEQELTGNQAIGTQADQNIAARNPGEIIAANAAREAQENEPTQMEDNTFWDQVVANTMPWSVGVTVADELMRVADMEVDVATVRVNEMNNLDRAQQMHADRLVSEAIEQGIETPEGIGAYVEKAFTGAGSLISPELEIDILSGEADPGAVPAPAFDDAMQETLFMTGARYLGENEERADMIAQGYTTIEDPTDPERERVIVLPQTMQPAAFDAVWTEAKGGEENPLIRVPEDYVAKVWEASDLARQTNEPGVAGEFADKKLMQIHRGLREDRVVREVAADHRVSDVYDMMASLAPSDVFRFQRLAADANFYERPLLPGYFSDEDQAIIGQALGQSNESGFDFWTTMEDYARNGRINTQNAEERAKKDTATTRIRDPFVVPAHLRSIPGEKTVAEETKERFQRKIGREARPDELANIAADLTGYYETSRQEEMALYLAAYNGDNAGLLNGAALQRIEDPGAATSFDISETYANEIDLNNRRESNSDTFQRMMNATMGGRAGYGQQTAAGAVTQIERGR